MSVTTRTNRATNPNVAAADTNWSAVPGTGGSATGARNAGAGYDGAAGFYRVSWTVATTAASGGANYLQTGLAAATEYTHSVYVKANKAITVRLAAQYQTAASANVNLVNGTDVALVANEWTRLSVTATSGASVDRVVLKTEATSGLWANGDTLDVDCVLIETGSVLDVFFDGSYVDSLGIMHAWTGPVDASTSAATKYAPVLALLVKTDAPTDRVEVTITDLTPTDNTVTLWRTAGGKRQAVRGFRKVKVIGSDFVDDFEAPLGRFLTYELEVVSGVGAGAASATASTTVPVDASNAYGWIQDPLDPESAMKLYGAVGPTGEPSLMGEAIKALEYAADISIIPILGSPDPIALLGQRLSAAGVSFSMVTEAAQQSTDLRNLILQAPLLLIRPLPEWSSALPPLCYIAPGTPTELPVNEAWGGAVINWKINAPLVAAPTMNVLIPIWTYQDWQDLWTTYQQAQTALSGDTYLQVKKSPSGA